VNAASGDVDLLVTGGSLVSAVVDDTPDIAGANVTLRVTGATSTIGVSAANRVEIDATTLNAATDGAVGNDIFVLDTAGGLAAGSINAGAGNVDLRVLGGSLTSATVDGTPDIVGSTVTLAVTGAGNDIGAGAGGRLELNATTLNAATAGAAGDEIFVLDTAGGLAAGSINAGAGDVDLRITGGSLTSATVDGTPDVVGGTVTLEVTSAGSTLGSSAANPLEINATTLNASTAGTGGDDLLLLNTAGGVVGRLVEGGGGNRNL